MTDPSSPESDSAGTIFYWLLLCLVLALVVAPQFDSTWGSILQRASLTCVLIAAVIANRRRRPVFFTGLAIATVAVPTLWSSTVVDSPTLSLGHQAILTIFCAFTAGAILVSVMRDHIATHQSIAGIVCVYLLLGLTWACAYSAIEHVQENSFTTINRHTGGFESIDRPMTTFSRFVYLSFVTMSTLGYGDITPRSSLAETATWLQAVVGQFFIAVLVARLLSVLPGPIVTRQVR